MFSGGSLQLGFRSPILIHFYFLGFIDGVNRGRIVARLDRAEILTLPKT